MSKAEADQLRAAWDYIERNGFRVGTLGYEQPGDECSACALGALAAAAQLDVKAVKHDRDPYRWIVEKTLPAATRLAQARDALPVRPGVDIDDVTSAIWRYSDNVVRTINNARQWFADAIKLAEADA
ncbi:DUF6197 family protein [Mycobacteroides chelonae]|uniref:DUF6197 family protein n=1 Tax=Mycobacteroides chelonae TaxID=1774 RepID=UPI000991C17F|nr:hypothetical protein [Mycobacteroides chelonae]